MEKLLQFGVNKFFFEGTNLEMSKQSEFILFLKDNPSVYDILVHPHLPEILNPTVSGFHPVILHFTGGRSMLYGNSYLNQVIDANQYVTVVNGSESAINNGIALSNLVRTIIKESNIILFKGTDLTEQDLLNAGVKKSRAMRSAYFKKDSEFIRIRGIAINNLKDFLK